MEQVNMTAAGKLDYQMQPVRGKRVLITGGTTGIGRAIALLLASLEARVLVVGRQQQELDSAMRELNAVGHAYGLTADMAKQEDVQRTFQEVDRQLGDLDILINNAALPAESIGDMDTDSWRYVIETNLIGYLACTREALDRMRPRRQGHIVQIGSMSADVRETGSSVYVATKSGIQGFSEALRKEVNKDGIKVTLIQPGSVGTDMPESTPEEQRQSQEELEQLKAEDIAACVLYTLVQPARVDVVRVDIRPHLQEI